MAAPWGAILGGLGGALGGIFGGSSQEKAAREANKPKPFHQTTTNDPGLAGAYLFNIMGEAERERWRRMANFRSGADAPPKPVMLGGYRGPRGASGRTQGIIGDILARARGPSPHLDAGRSFISSTLGGQANPLMQRAFDRADTSSAGRGLLNRFIEQRMSGSAPGASYTTTILDRILSRGDAQPRDMMRDRSGRRYDERPEPDREPGPDFQGRDRLRGVLAEILRHR